MTSSATVRSFRDLLLISPTRELVMACDSVGGIGPRSGDTYEVDGRDSAHFAARVPLLETLCAGARPIALVDTLCQDKVSAAPLIEEFREIASDAGIPPEAVTGSTEDNVQTTMTGIGVVVLGELDNGLLSGGARPGDLVICVGLPRSAPHVRLYRGHPDIVPIADVLALVRSGRVSDALPVGSRGLAWEVPELARTSGLTARWTDQEAVPVDASGGPSTCVLISCAPEDEPCLRSIIGNDVPWNHVATLEEA